MFVIEIDLKKFHRNKIHQRPQKNTKQNVEIESQVPQHQLQGNATSKMPINKIDFLENILRPTEYRNAHTEYRIVLF